MSRRRIVGFVLAVGVLLALTLWIATRPSTQEVSFEPSAIAEWPTVLANRNGKWNFLDFGRGAM